MGNIKEFASFHIVHQAICEPFFGSSRMPENPEDAGQPSPMTWLSRQPHPCRPADAGRGLTGRRPIAGRRPPRRYPDRAAWRVALRWTVAEDFATWRGGRPLAPLVLGWTRGEVGVRI